MIPDSHYIVKVSRLAYGHHTTAGMIMSRAKTSDMAMQRDISIFESRDWISTTCIRLTVNKLSSWLFMITMCHASLLILSPLSLLLTTYRLLESLPQLLEASRSLTDTALVPSLFVKSENIRSRLIS
jgi:hypothetical protein